MYQLYLSPNGDFFRVAEQAIGQRPKGVDLNSDQIPSDLKKAASCKTHDAVLLFLQSLTPETSKNYEFLHYNNSKHSNHNDPFLCKIPTGIPGFNIVKGPQDSHECPPKKMIDFVQKQITERNLLLNSRLLRSFIKIQNILNHSLRQLNQWAIYPIIGIIPGVLIFGIGACETVAALAMTLFSAIPAAFHNKEAEALAKRSFKHISTGVLNIVRGALLGGLPLIGNAIVIASEPTETYRAVLEGQFSDGAYAVRYKKFTGAVKYDASQKKWSGQVLGFTTRETIYFECHNRDDIEEVFKKTIDNYFLNNQNEDM